MSNLQFLARALSGQAWSITPQALDHLHNQITSGQPLKVDADQPTPDAAVQRVPLLRNNGKTVALVSMHGVIVSRAPDWAERYGYVNPQNFAAQIRTLADDSSVSSIIVSVDSPGGSVAGTVDAADAVAYARSRKKVTAVVNDMACSAAYWAVSQASEIVVSPTAMTGSIGVLIVHTDYSKMLGTLGIVVSYIRSAAKKALGQPYEPLSDEARAEFQSTVDRMNAQFVQAVAKGRRKGRALVAESWATGEIWIGADAVMRGLADRVASLQTVLGEQTGATLPPDPSPQPPAPEDDDLEARASPPPAADSGPPAEQNANATDHPPAPTEAGASIPDSAPQAQEEQTMKIEDILAKVQNGQALSAEERAALNAHLDAQGTAPATSVDLSQLSAEARAIVESAQAEAAAARQEAQTAQATANTERDSRLNREFGERAAALGLPATMAATLRSASEKLSEDEYKALEQSLNARGAQDALLGESGSSQDNRSSSGNTKADYAARVDAAMKADPKLSRAEAGRQVMKADPAFAARYNARR